MTKNQSIIKKFEVIQYPNDRNFFRVLVKDKKLQEWLGDGVVGIGTKDAFKNGGKLWDRIVFPTKNGEKPMWSIPTKITDKKEWGFTCMDMYDDLEFLRNK